MKRKEVYQILRKRHPEATNIAPNEFGLWDVDIEDEFEKYEFRAFGGSPSASTSDPHS